MIPISHSKQPWSNLPTWLFTLLFFSLPFFHKYSTIIVGGLFLLTLIQIIKTKRIQEFQSPWFLPALFFYYAISVWLSDGLWSTMEKRIMLIALPLLFALNPAFYQMEMRKKAFLGFIMGNLVAIAVCFVRATYRSLTWIDGHWVFHPEVDQMDSFLLSSVMAGNYYFGYEFSFFLPTPTYFGIFIVFAQYLIFELLKSPEFKKKKRWLIACYFVFLFTLFLLSSKAAIITSLLLSFYIAYYILSTFQVSSLARLLIISGIIAMTSLFLLFNPRLRSLVETIKKGELINPNARFGDDLRMLSWDASVDVIKENPVIGVGEGKKDSRLKEIYIKKGYTYPAEQMLNSHNQYLDFLMGGGLIGLVLFLSGQAQFFIRSIKKHDTVLLGFLLIFSLNALFENLLSRHAGVLFFALFATLLSRQAVADVKTPQV
jgi:O-antigen ligase